ncbi:MAG: ABC transporter substrate-binding protein [Rhodospirillaceae bacterium]|nr:ABC transporter substrate-binding protein [Rhodospirillaceae bacterium]
MNLRISRRAFTSGAVSAALALLPSVVFAQGTSNVAATFVGDFAQKGIADILAAPIPNTEKQQRFREMFKQYFDLPGIGRFVLTRYWKAATPEEQTKFTSLFEDVIVYTWSRRFSEYNGQTLKVTGEQPDGGDGMLVKSTIVGKNNTNFGVDWRLRKRGDGLKVLDVVIEGVSMAITYRQDYSTVISQTGSFAGLLAQMEKQVADLKQQQGA